MKNFNLISKNTIESVERNSRTAVTGAIDEAYPVTGYAASAFGKERLQDEKSCRITDANIPLRFWRLFGVTPCWEVD